MITKMQLFILFITLLLSQTDECNRELIFSLYLIFQCSHHPFYVLRDLHKFAVTKKISRIVL